MRSGPSVVRPSSSHRLLNKRFLSTPPNPGSPHSQPQADLSWPDPAKQFGKRRRHPVFISPPLPFCKERMGQRRNKEPVGLPTLQPPLLSYTPAASLKPQSLFAHNPKGKKREMKKGEKAAAADFKRRANLCSPGQPHLHNEMCRGCLAHVFFRRFNFNFI